VARLILEHVVKAFGEHRALDDVSLEVEDGELIAILGPSGCGKTTLLRQVAGFDTLDAGRILIGDAVMSSTSEHVPPERRRIGIVFQSYALWPHMTVAENVAYGLTVAGVREPERSRRVDAALELVDLGGFAQRRPAQLSGGQRQRVALARCLVTEPSLVLLDEPLANLDVHLRAAMENEFARFHARTGTTMVYITHDQREAMATVASAGSRPRAPGGHAVDPLPRACRRDGRRVHRRRHGRARQRERDPRTAMHGRGIRAPRSDALRRRTAHGSRASLPACRPSSHRGRRRARRTRRRGARDLPGRSFPPGRACRAGA